MSAATRTRTIRAPLSISPPDDCRHRPESTLLYQLIEHRYPPSVRCDLTLKLLIPRQIVLFVQLRKVCDTRPRDALRTLCCVFHDTQMPLTYYQYNTNIAAKAWT
jgi:hypothetical protein